MYFSVEHSLERLAVFASYSDCDGCEDAELTSQLIEGLLMSGVHVELLLLNTQDHHPHRLPAHPHLSVKTLRASSVWLAVPELKRYMQSHPGEIVLAVDDQFIQAASMANLLSGLRGNVAGLMHHDSWSKSSPGGGLRLSAGLMRVLYGYTSGVITESADTGKTLELMCRLPKARIKMLAQPCRQDVAISGCIELLTEWQCCGVCSVNSGRYLSA
jgi:hypothetical protein